MAISLSGRNVRPSNRRRRSDRTSSSRVPSSRLTRRIRCRRRRTILTRVPRMQLDIHRGRCSPRCLTSQVIENLQFGVVGNRHCSECNTNTKPPDPKAEGFRCDSAVGGKTRYRDLCFRRTSCSCRCWTTTRCDGAIPHGNDRSHQASTSQAG